MNQEKKVLQMDRSVGEYLAPKVEVVEIKARRVICQSQVTTGFTDMENEDGEW